MVATLATMPRTDSDRSDALRALPAVDLLLRAADSVAAPAAVRTRCARAWLDELRAAALAGALDAAAVRQQTSPEACRRELTRRCALATERRHQRVVNATGIVLHTGLGRAPLPAAAVQAITDAAGYAIVEVDPQSGERDQRELGVAALLCGLTGAGGALVVNNNAAATTLMLTALTAGREVVISRGELVEIGGGFRMPDVMQRAGCTMVEVGATNRTHLRDYAAATREATGAYLKVHPSNFRIEGFAGTPSVAELVQLGSGRGIPVLDDLGSGFLCREPIAGLEHEPRVLDSLAMGAKVTCFSGDKLLGGPQCGILLGEAKAIAACRAHPLYRALRCDKLTLAALEAVLLVYRDGSPLQEIPTLRLLAAGADELRARSEALLALLPGLGGEVVPSESFAGSGANPARPLPSFAVAIRGGDAEAERLRTARPVGVFARRASGRVLLDARSLLLEDLPAVAAAVRAALA
jgi:L-seryl-tRNA(Ser) seleniumtransferase